MKKLIWIILGLAILGLTIYKLSSNKKIAEGKVYQYDRERPISVQVDTIRAQFISDVVSYTGTFEPKKEAKISAEGQGKINALYVDIGSKVSKSQTLFQLDNSLLKLQLQAVEVQIEGLQDDVNRYKILTEADAVQGVQLEKAQLGLEAAEVQKATIQEQIKKATTKAPFDGVVTAKLNEVGGFAAPGVPIVQLTDISHLKFTINVPENDLREFHRGKEYEISADSYSKTPLTGKVIMIGSKANPGNSFPVQFQVSNTQNLDIKSGMFGKVNIDTEKREKGILIPSSAIIRGAGKEQVYVVKQGKAVLQTINVSQNIRNKVIVAEGLDENDIIVIKGLINLFEGANVKINN